MDIRARNLALAPFTDTGDPADCSWLTKAAALGAFDEDHDSDEGTIEHYSAAQRIAIAIIGTIALAALLFLFFKPF
ncbi:MULTISPECIES: hypothetical protein [unclassified Novosphingobium]|uniref:hypothetical protein n=1 Tax=unclassified Novosphingobium TaxID=2644732 RepID=UPI00086CE721|nr:MULTISPECIES: hypothetical protein [unclassified Novosphingobium]MBN9146099.1 hypothetical protein [Novosphingobium sp.]ODU79210.1 MAG: hypothetical protein ABT10_21055 [Novosphingobium sp. SCN 63-17]OJX93221.1 MAG: hypothetical protein BGP00_06175 [Novosphingobium sp. 63-713]